MAALILVDDLMDKMPDGWTVLQVQDEIDAATAWVRIHVPCVDRLDENALAAVRAVLRKAIPYNASLGSGATGTVSTVNAGPLGFSTADTVPRDSGGYFSPAQISALAGLCGSRRGRFGTIMTRPL